MPHDALLKRIRAEYLEMPGLQLQPAQAQRLWGLEAALCDRVLDALIDTQFLRVTPNGAYARVTDGPEGSRRRAAKADLVGPRIRAQQAS
jgi:hypothetical protein